MLVVACLGGFFGAVGSLLAKQLFPTLTGWFSNYPVWVLPAIGSALVALLALGLMLVPLLLKDRHRGKPTDA
jgi:hypothetical protein